ncbi:MAG: chorismate mutase [Ignavibacteriaceae bacterium]
MKIELEITPISEWLKYSKPILISGPCSAESEEQMIKTAKQIVKYYPNNIFRAGIWKPRTRPSTFEGVGEIGLQWLQNVKRETGMLVTTEVANARHVELCLKYEIDLFWIGARTTGNPFSVQEIADSLKGVDVPILVKNSLNPDIQLWIGALERINNAGIKKLAAIHRGFHSLEQKQFRYSPLWNVPIELKTLLPQLPIFCDVSHISGDRELISIIAQEAMNLNMDGLMVETHFNPDIALSDSKQQVTPDTLFKTITQLQIRKPSNKNNQSVNKLEEFRILIDNIDSELISLLTQRMKVSEKIGSYKKENNLAIFQVDRWRKTINKSIELGKSFGLDEEFVKYIFTRVHDESIKKQAEIMNQEFDPDIINKLFSH